MLKICVTLPRTITFNCIGKADNSSSSEARLINTLHQVAKLYIYTADKNNVKRLLDDFGGVVTRKFMRKMDTAVNDPVGIYIYVTIGRGVGIHLNVTFAFYSIT